MRSPPKVPSASENQKLATRLARSKIAVFLDYDGTLTPIMDSPSQSALSPETRKVLKELAELCPVIILSGRDAENLRKMAKLKDIIYAGCYGFDIITENGKRLRNTNWDSFLPVLDVAEENLTISLKEIPKVLVERKRFALAIHYRTVAKTNLPILKRRFNGVAAQFPSLKKIKGNKILELLPDVQWNKGTALISVMDTLGLGTKALPVVIGDDLSDEDAFCAVKEKGLGILVGGSRRGTFAQYSLRNHVEVRAFLGQLTRGLRAR